MWPASYAETSSSTSIRTTPGSDLCSTTQSAGTRADSLLMCCSSGGGCGVWLTDTLDQQIGLTAEAQTDRRVDERGDQGETGGDDAEQFGAAQVTDQSEHGEDQSDQLG